MLLVISPAKNLDYGSAPATEQFSQPDMLDQAQVLIDDLKKLAPQDISALMKLSDKLGQLNYDRFQSWSQPFSVEDAKQAVLAFNGDVYTGLDAASFSEEDFAYMQEHLRILSGLYGLLKPLDLMQAYRLEMGTRFENTKGKNLYEFWGEQITDAINAQLESLDSQTLVNLASTEYFKSVKPKLLKANVITPAFKDWKNGQYKMISFYAKKARGMMAAYILKNRIDDIEGLKGFNTDGYEYNAELSTDKVPVFTRRLEE